MTIHVHDHRGEEETSTDAHEERWDLPSDFDLYAKHEIKHVCYPPKRRGRDDGDDDAGCGGHSFRIECIEPDTPLDINNKSQSSAEYDATGHCVWAGALLLVRRIRELSGTVDVGNRRVIELGCGTGVGGLAMLLVNDAPTVVPSHVCFTDSDPDALEVCERNCRLNDLPESSYAIRELTWGEDVDRVGEGFDIALATDVLYDVDLIHPLFMTVSRCIPPGGMFILSHIPRACYNEGNPPEAVEDLEKYIIDQAVRYDLHLVDILRPPKEDGLELETKSWCSANSFVGGGILVFRRS